MTGAMTAARSGRTPTNDSAGSTCSTVRPVCPRGAWTWSPACCRSAGVPVRPASTGPVASTWPTRSGTPRPRCACANAAIATLPSSVDRSRGRYYYRRCSLLQGQPRPSRVDRPDIAYEQIDDDYRLFLREFVNVFNSHYCRSVYMTTNKIIIIIRRKQLLSLTIFRSAKLYL